MAYSLNLNQNTNNTVSMKLRRNSLITNYIINDINGYGKRKDINEQTRYENISQMIKRYMVYNTTNPLASKSKDANGKYVVQNDITQDLTTKGSSAKSLYNGSFSEDTPTSDQNYIFVYNTSNSYRKSADGWATMHFNISVIIPDLYDNVVDIESGLNIKKGDAISLLINDLLDEYTIDNEDYSTYIGNVTFNLIGSNISRLSNAGSNVIYTLGYEVVSTGYRV